MGKPTGFLEIERKLAPKRAVSERVNDYKEIELLNTPEETVAQASRCMKHHGKTHRQNHTHENNL
jgi:glutamate synthase (NADPH/NADH) small chain